MSAGIYNIDLEQGSDYGLDIVYKDGDGDLIDLTSYGARMDIKDSPDSDAITSLTNTNGGLIIHTIATSSPNIQISMTAGATAALDFDNEFYDLEVFSGISVSKVLRGRVKLIKEITK